MECDIWSAGVILYILLCGFPPFDQDAAVSVIFDLIKHARYDFPAPYWDDVSEEAKKLVSGMLTADPKSRLTCSECLGHPWVLKFYQGGLSTSPKKDFKTQLEGRFIIGRKLKGAILTFAALSRFQSCLSYHATAREALEPTPLEALEVLRVVRGDEKRLAELRASFDLLDRNHLDQITVEDVAEFLHKFGNYTSHAEAKKMVDGIDLYHLGHISFDEFCIMMGPSEDSLGTCGGGGQGDAGGRGEHAGAHPNGCSMPPTARMAPIDATFELLDSQHTGEISEERIKQVLTQLGAECSDEEVHKMVALACESPTATVLHKPDFERLLRLPSR
ncbi:hypothetical protein T484DRAFT_1895004 [Baffinella frigidus]|nr:hypothetical protein T484DRAFT_1895004 [Cryptophyta sp. CCMP2293]